MKKILASLFCLSLLLTACQKGEETLSLDQCLDTFPDYFQEYWQTAEDAPASIPEGVVFFADLDSNAVPELYLTYSTGMGRQIGLLAFDLQKEKPECLGVSYLALAENGDTLAFSLGGENEKPVLTTKGQVPMGAANSNREYIESFLTLSNGQLNTSELTYSVDENKNVIYYNASQDRKEVSQQEYKALRSEYLRSDEPLLTIQTSGKLNFLENTDLFADSLKESLKNWQENQSK
ncbi:MAG: hypothetical protein ACI4L5_04315 [Negativibacillus sp.]